MSVDHDHATGKNRGLLCTNCNKVLGHAKDDVTILRRAIAYLEAHAEPKPGEFTTGPLTMRVTADRDELAAWYGSHGK